jgi:hypothetical protein
MAALVLSVAGAAAGSAVLGPIGAIVGRLTMVSEAKTDKQKRSKGGVPRTAAGKMMSRMNARKHGLSIPLKMNGNKSTFDIAQAIAGNNANDDILGQALVVAECELMLQRIDQARVAAIEQAMSEVPKQAEATAINLAGAFAEALPTLSGIERYERRIYSRKKRAVAHLHDLQAIAQLKF